MSYPIGQRVRLRFDETYVTRAVGTVTGYVADRCQVRWDDWGDAPERSFLVWSARDLVPVPEATP